MRMTMASLVLAFCISGCAHREPAPADLAARYIGYSISSLRAKLGEEATVEPRDGRYAYFWSVENRAGTGACEIDAEVHHNGSIQAVRLTDTNTGIEACRELFSNKG